MVHALREELGTSQGTVRRVADQLGYGVESVRGWVKQADIDAGEAPGTTSGEQARIAELEQEVRELRRANAIWKSSATFFVNVMMGGSGGFARFFAAPPAGGGLSCDLRPAGRPVGVA